MLDISNLISALPGGIAQGFIWGLMALGVYITFRLLDIADLSVDGTFTTGGAVCVVLVTGGMNVYLAVIIATLAGALAGLVTGLLHTKLGIPAILAGILTQLSLYSINLWIMNFSSNQVVSVDKFALILSSRNITYSIIVGAIICVIIIALLYWYFGTERGCAMRATGCNPEMSKAQGININTMKIVGLALSNGIVALSGALLAQYQGFADINMGRGAIAIGLACIIIGEVIGKALAGKHLNFAVRMGFVVFGGVAYYIAIIIVLWLRLNSNFLKLFTSVIVAIFLAVPYLQSSANSSFAKAGKKSVKSNKEVE